MNRSEIRSLKILTLFTLLSVQGSLQSLVQPAALYFAGWRWNLKLITGCVNAKWEHDGRAVNFPVSIPYPTILPALASTTALCVSVCHWSIGASLSLSGVHCSPPLSPSWNKLPIFCHISIQSKAKNRHQAGTATSLSVLVME